MNSGNTYTVLSLLGSLVLFVLILVLAWFCVRWLGGQYRLNTAGSRVKVLERIALAPDRSPAGGTGPGDRYCCWV